MIKPNVAFDKNPDLAATTQPDTVAAVTRLCLGAGARKVIVADNPINNPESCFYKTKVGEAAIRAGAELMLPKDSYFESLYIGGETITSTWRMFYRPFREATKVIGISPVKDHNLCKATVTLKNWYGLLGNPRNQFHQNIHGIISDFALMMKPSLVIADGRKLLMRNGPTGGSLNDVKRGDTMVIGTDHIAVDSWCVTKLLERPARSDSLPRQGDRPRSGPGLASAVDAGDHGMSTHLRKARPRPSTVQMAVPIESGLRVSDQDFLRLCRLNPELRWNGTPKGSWSSCRQPVQIRAVAMPESQPNSGTGTSGPVLASRLSRLPASPCPTLRSAAPT